MYQSVDDLLRWSRVIRRESADLLLRYRLAEPDQPARTVLLPGAELICPMCSGEARPDEAETATCGTCGTLSPLDAAVAFSNTVHQTLHSGVRLRLAMVAGLGGEELPAVTTPFPLLVLRIGSYITLAAIDGQRRSQLDDLLRKNEPVMRRWVQREADEGSLELARGAQKADDGVEIANAVMSAAFGELPEGFPKESSIAFPLEQIFHCAAQYHKMRTSSMYATWLAEHAARGLRTQMGLTSEDPLPWRDTSPFARFLHPGVRAEQRKKRYRASEEALARATVHHLGELLGLLATTTGRHRALLPVTETAP